MEQHGLSFSFKKRPHTDMEVDHGQPSIKGVSQLHQNEERRLSCTDSMHTGSPLTRTVVDSLT